MNKEQLKLQWKYFLLSFFSGIVALRLIFGGINSIYSYYTQQGLISNPTGVAGFMNIFIEKFGLLFMLIGIAGILIGLFLVKVSIDIYKEKRWAIIFFLIFSIILLFFDGGLVHINRFNYYLMQAVSLLISIVISIKILTTKKLET